MRLIARPMRMGIEARREADRPMDPPGAGSNPPAPKAGTEAEKRCEKSQGQRRKEDRKEGRGRGMFTGETQLS